MPETNEVSEFMQYYRGQVWLSFSEGEKVFEVDFDYRRVIPGQGSTLSGAVARQGNGAFGVGPFRPLVYDDDIGEILPLDDWPATNLCRTGRVIEPDRAGDAVIENLFAPALQGEAIPHIHRLHDLDGFLGIEVPLFQGHGYGNRRPATCKTAILDESRWTVLDHGQAARLRRLPSGTGHKGEQCRKDENTTPPPSKTEPIPHCITPGIPDCFGVIPDIVPQDVYRLE